MLLSYVTLAATRVKPLLISRLPGRAGLVAMIASGRCSTGHACSTSCAQAHPSVIRYARATAQPCQAAGHSVPRAVLWNLNSQTSPLHPRPTTPPPPCHHHHCQPCKCQHSTTHALPAGCTAQRLLLLCSLCSSRPRRACAQRCSTSGRGSRPTAACASAPDAAAGGRSPLEEAEKRWEAQIREGRVRQGDGQDTADGQGHGMAQQALGGAVYEGRLRWGDGHNTARYVGTRQGTATAGRRTIGKDG